MIRRPPRSTLFPYTTSSDLDPSGVNRLTGENRLDRSGDVALDPGDEYGVEAALRLKESLGAEVVAVSMTPERDRKSTRLNSSHTVISYAVFCLIKTLHNTHY